MSSWLSLKRKKERDELKEEKQRYYSSLAPSLSHFSRLSRAVRIGVLSSLLIVEPLLLPVSVEAQEVQKAKDFKKQSSNIVKVESMAKGGDMVQKVKEQEVKKKEEIKNLMAQFLDEKSQNQYDVYKQLKQKREEDLSTYKAAWSEFSKNKEKKDLFGKYFSIYSDIESLKVKEGKETKSLLEKCDQTERLGVGTHTVIPIDEKTLKFFEDKENAKKVEFLKKMYPSLSFSLDETDKTAPKLVIDYKIIDEKSAKQLNNQLEQNTIWFVNWLKKAGFNEIFMSGAGAGSEGNGSTNFIITARGPKNSLSVNIDLKYEKGEVKSSEIVNWNSSDEKKSESLRAEFQDLLTDNTDKLTSLFYTFNKKDIDFMMYFNTKTEVYNVFYGKREYDVKGNEIGYSSYRLEGDPKRFLFEAQRMFYERLYAIPSDQRRMYYWMMNYIKPTLDASLHGMNSQPSSLIASGEAYKTGRLVVKIGDKYYTYDGKGSIPLPNGDKLFFSDIQIKRTETGLIKYISAIQYTAEMSPIRTVDLPIYTTHDFVYDQKTGSSVKITLEPSKELLENIDFNKFSYTIKVSNDAVGYVKPPASGEEALKIKTQIEGIPYEIKLLSVKDKATFNSPRPDLSATIVVKNLNTNEEVKTELNADQLFNLKLGDKTIPIKIESPQWEFLTMSVSERVEQSAIVKRDELKEGASQVTITVIETDSVPYLEKIFGKTKITGQYGYLELQNKAAPVIQVTPTAYNLIVENENTGEGFGLTAINGDPYLKEGVYSSADDLKELFIKKKIPIFSDYFGATGYFYYKQVGKQIEEGKSKAEIMKDLETNVFTAYLNLPYIISGEIGTKHTKIYKEMLDSQYETKGKEYSIFYEASDWNKGGPYVLKFDYRRKTLGQGQEVPYLDNINLYMTSGWTITKVPSSLNPWDIFERVRVSWDHTDIQNEKRVPFGTGKDEISENINNNVIRLRMEGKRIFAEVYYGKEKTERERITGGVESSEEIRKWINGIILGASKAVGVNKEIGVNLNMDKTTTENIKKYESSNYNSLSFSAEPYYIVRDSKGNKLRISFVYGLTKTEAPGQGYAEQKRGFTVSNENWRVYTNYVSDNSSFLKKGGQKLLETGIGYSGTSSTFNLSYINSINGWSFNIFWSKRF